MVIVYQNNVSRKIIIYIQQWQRSLRTSGSVAHVGRKQLRARLETRCGRISPSACICRWAGRIYLFSAIFKN